MLTKGAEQEGFVLAFIQTGWKSDLKNSIRGLFLIN